MDLNELKPYKSYSGTSISAKWDYNGTMIGISTSSPYSPNTEFIQQMAS